MENSNARHLSPEVTEFLDSIRSAKGIEAITALVQKEITLKLEEQLSDFEQALAQTNLATIEMMRSELTRIKEESESLSGVVKRLGACVAPDVSGGDEEVVSFRQAIDNLEKYGSVIPSSNEIIAYKIRFEQNRAWSLFWQSLVKLLIKKVEEKLGNRAVS